MFSPGEAYGLGWYGTSLDGKPCAGVGQEDRPHDYSDPAESAHLRTVESFHFGEEVRWWDPSARQRGGIRDDLLYTLREFPNHHLALETAAKAYLKKKDSLPRPPECYFYRAIVFRPNDYAVYALFGVYLHRRGDPKGALEMYEQALAVRPSNPEVHYNMGLALVDLGRYAEARNHAQQAYALGYPLPGLRNRLKRAGQWAESPKEPARQDAAH